MIKTLTRISVIPGLFITAMEPSRRTQFQQLNSLTVEGVTAPGVTLGAALETFEKNAVRVFPRGFSDLVIAAGLGIGTLLTLFVVPAFYLLLAERHKRAT